MPVPASITHFLPRFASEDGPWIFPHTEFQNCEQRLSAALADDDSRLVVVSGAPGVGKSTLTRRAVERARRAQDSVTAVVSTHLAPRELLRALAYGLGIDVDTRGRRQSLARTIGEHVAGCSQVGQRTLASVDEANNLPDDSLAELLSLARAQEASVSKLSILLAGGADLPSRVARLCGRMRPVYLELAPIRAADINDYLTAELAALAWQQAPQLSEGALNTLAASSGGIARRMNMLCTRLILHADVEDLLELDQSDIECILAELQDEWRTPFPGGCELGML